MKCTRRLAWAVASLYPLLSGSLTAGESVDYTRDIKPILHARCYSCHGALEQESGLRLDTAKSMRQGGDSGAAIAPQSPDESLLLERITAGEGERMPPEGEPLNPQEIDLIRRWIAQGAVAPEDEQPQADPRDHWAFQPVTRPAVPRPRDSNWVENPIDAFILKRLEEEQIAPSPRADRVTLIRRLYLDLLGLPPSPEAVQDFAENANPDAWPQLVDRVLASPAFGERWGRHWLDLARYADSNGYEDDRQRPDAWRFRDWVIDAFNRDLPYDAFTIWQLAGDLLPNTQYEQQVAAGFHRMTLSNEGGADSVEEEYRIIAVKDRVDTTCSVWLGLSVGCAKCHTHKYDPISQREYYELFAFFNNGDHASIPAPAAAPQYVAAYEAELKSYHERLAALKARLAEYERRVLQDTFTAWCQSARHEPDVAESVRELLAVPTSKRSTKQQLQLARLIEPIDPRYVEVMGNELVNAGNNRPLPPSTHAMTFTTLERTSHIHERGNFLDLGEPVQPGTPEFLPPLDPRGDRPDRLDLARWIVDERNPLTSRVAVNRVWQHLFGRGLVATADEFGTISPPPSHPELLDWLATEFVDIGWSRKSLIRLIVTSSTYQQSSRTREELQRADPENVLLGRQLRRRLDAECVRDVALATAGLLNRQIGGPPFQPALPAGLMDLDAVRNERFMEPSDGSDRYRRGTYINVQRMMMLPMLQVFDVADANATCARRDQSNTPLQALTVLNDPSFVEAAQALARRVIIECDSDSYERIRFAFQLCLSRLPDDVELRTLDGVYRTHVAFYREHASVAQALLGDATVPEGMSPAECAAWTGVARTLLNLDEFITRE